MQLSALFLSAITAAVCVNAATIPSHIKAEGQDNLLQARSYDSVDSDNEAHLERRSPGYATHNFGGFGGNGFGVRSWNMVQPGFSGFSSGFGRFSHGGFGGGGFGMSRGY
ncbi:hypothetical protein BASA50_007157 [Batrachochytrium salamandrivorans]|uniref:Uncharacterized protein n=1 Tax=Batrachochytrium salamandrivorans TaxID=1357716 RepID=A0ABQ8F7S9_9FUNG|nr:hypothetical protein BASA62_006247 [Batrachochytrium salamandrivorans]KAH6578201.1 hypothetical protein BASA60_003738 [Batrachochytrium salamandrivorans]KAH6593721.1 hypothetical protein BASA50_007157 [Batrachochytrium salamandrivorans]KAH9252463.1 hypothetical protein BASA81_009587 [Batrachochytrium salamandrivorans]KAH9265186.1 hypothetical protein BASA83_011269 [Batrachochytrium salamandrivorans]